MNFLRSNTIGTRILVPILLLSAIVFFIATLVNISFNRELIKEQFNIRGNELADCISKSCASGYASPDSGSLDGLVKEITKSADISFAVFYDDNLKPLTHVSIRPADSSDLLVFEREIKNDAGKLLGKFFIGLKKDAFYSVAQKSVIFPTISALITLILVIFGIVFVVRNNVVFPFKKLMEFAEQLASGNLAAKIEIDDIEEIVNIIGPLKNQAECIQELMGKLFDSVNQLNLSSNNILAAVEEQASVASQQSASVTEITATMEEFSASSRQIAEHSKEVVEIANQTQEKSKRGAQFVEEFSGKMYEIRSENQKNIDEILQLGKKSKEISKVMEIINNVADQTKLIAFNAALEASSAGEAGKRFGVVASEIRRLADNVMESTGEIENKINEIQEATQNLVLASEKSSTAVQEGVNSSVSFVETLEGIVSGNLATTEAARQISLSTQQQRTASDQVVVALKEIELGSRQTSESIRHINDVCKGLVTLASDFRKLLENRRQKPIL
ncbi:MAG: methyl-accepting chemotaxis protein [Candidatus Riflebacteria bacterium]|nr:methyl-accepting chemotaxis protein [Candidatus Riflebacteria bacterium]